MNLRKTLLLFLMPLLLLTGCGNDLAITVTYSDTHNLISGPDATVVYPGKLRDGAEYYYAPSGQLQAFIRRSLDVVQEDEALDDAQLERHARDFLAQLGFPEEDFWVQDAFSNDSGQQLLFENPDQDVLRVFLQKNGQVYSLNVWDHERFAPEVTARQKAYFDRALQRQLDARENTAFLVSQSVSYKSWAGCCMPVTASPTKNRPTSPRRCPSASGWFPFRPSWGLSPGSLSFWPWASGSSGDGKNGKTSDKPQRAAGSCSPRRVVFVQSPRSQRAIWRSRG